MIPSEINRCALTCVNLPLVIRSRIVAVVSRYVGIVLGSRCSAAGIWFVGMVCLAAIVDSDILNGISCKLVAKLEFACRSIVRESFICAAHIAAVDKAGQINMNFLKLSVNSNI